jgi:hypothetical protein
LELASARRERGLLEGRIKVTDDTDDTDDTPLEQHT